MYKIMSFIVAALSILGVAGAAWAKPVDNIESYGVYVAGANGYVKFGPYQHMDNFVDFKYLHEVPAVTRADDQLKVIIYAKDFSENNFVFELRPIDIIVDIKPIRFDIKPLAQKDMYELTLDRPVPDGTMLHVHSGSFFVDNMGVIMLGDTESQLIKYFSQKQLEDPQGVHAYLEDALQAYPNNSELKKLMTYWSQTAAAAKDNKDYSYVEEQWEKYHGTEQISLKVRYLESMIGEINGYLDQHPEGAKAREAQERKTFAETKIKEFKKML